MTLGRNEHFTIASFRSAFGCENVRGVAQAETEAIIDIRHPIEGLTRERSCERGQRNQESYERAP